ncbi:MAG: putative Ig domain-containing protein [Methanomassiliicoccus sp.]|nr:putative Ig domain-containing protein [Methanomassiliicoccus sp.]
MKLHSLISHRRSRKALLGIVAALTVCLVVLAALPPASAVYPTSLVESTSYNYTGLYSSLALDQQGQPHIAYYTGTTGLHYASMSGGVWSYVTIDSASATAGKYPSLCIGSDNVPKVAYITDNTIRYAYLDGSTWITSNITTVGTADRCAMVLDHNNNPYVAYKDVSTSGRCVKCAHWTGSTWSLELIQDGVANVCAGLSIALDSNGNPHIAYSGPFVTGYKALVYYASKSYGVWTYQSTGVYCYALQSGSYYEQCSGVSLAIGSDDVPRIACASPGGTGCTYLYYNGASWTSQSITTTNFATPCQIALDSSNNAYVVFMASSSIGFQIATNAGGSWSVKVATTFSYVGGDNYAGTIGLAIDPYGLVHLSYPSSQQMRYAAPAHWSPSFSTSPVTTATVNHAYTYQPSLNETGTITAVTKPSWLTWDGSRLTGTPNALGSFTVSLRGVSTAGMGFTVQTFDITVTGWRPAFTTNAPNTLIAGHTYHYTVGVNESASITVMDKPSWMDWQSANSTFWGTPTVPGSYSLSIRATSTNGLMSAWQNVTIAVNQWAPSWTSSPSYMATVDHAYSYLPTTNETATLTALSVPSWMTWDGTILSGTPDTSKIGAWAVSLSAAGPGGLTAYQNFTVTVYDRERWMPMVSSSPADTIKVGEPYSYHLTANESVSIVYSGSLWLTWNPDTMTLEGMAPTSPQTAHISLGITSISGTLTYWQNWTVSVTADPPQIENPPQSGTQQSGSSYSYSFGGSGWGSAANPGPLRLNVPNAPEWLHYDPENGTVWGTPYVPGDYPVTGIVTNQTTGLSNQTDWVIHVPADPPEVTNDHTNTTTGEGGIAQPLDIIWTGEQYGYVLNVNPARCTVTITTSASWLTYDATNRTVKGMTLTAGTWNVSAAVYDPLTTLTSYANWTIEAIAPPPVISSAASFHILTNGYWSYTLVYTPSNGIVNITGLPSWMIYYDQLHTFSGTPTQAGTYALQVTVTNATSGIQATQTVTVYVDDDAPQIFANPLLKGQERTLYRWTASADQAVTWTLTTDAGSWLTIGSDSGRLSGTPTKAGSYHVTITATNSRGISSSYSYDLTVESYGTNGGNNGGSNNTSGGSITLPGGITIPTGGNASYSTTMSGSVLALFLIIIILVLVVMAKRRKGGKR